MRNALGSIGVVLVFAFILAKKGSIMKHVLGGIALVALFAVAFVVFHEIPNQPPPQEAPSVVEPASPTEESNDTAPTEEKETVRKAFALQGSVIASDDGERVTYFRKCEKCGHTQDNPWPMDVYMKGTSTFKCPECGNKQKVVIIRK